MNGRVFVSAVIVPCLFRWFSRRSRLRLSSISAHLC
jgi:hypothetical protein